MSDSAQQYTDLLMSLLQKRDAIGGGALGAAEEAEFAARLDYYWAAMRCRRQAGVELSLVRFDGVSQNGGELVDPSASFDALDSRQVLVGKPD